RAISDENQRRLLLMDLYLELLKAFLDRSEAGAGVAKDRVAAPAQIAKRDVLIGQGGGDERLQIAELLGPLDPRASKQNDAISVAQLPIGAPRTFAQGGHLAQ